MCITYCVQFKESHIRIYWILNVLWCNTEAAHRTFVNKSIYTHPFNGPLSKTTRVSRYQTVSGSGISWAICKFAPRARQITMPAPHHAVFTDWMPFLPPNQQCQSTEGTYSCYTTWLKRDRVCLACVVCVCVQCN